MKYGLFGSFVAKKGKRSELLDILVRASELLQQNDNCIHYIVSVSDEPDVVWVYESWLSKEGHDKSLEPEDIKSLIHKAMPLIESMGSQTELSIKGGKGIQS